MKPKKCTEKQYQMMIERYRQNPGDIMTCKYLAHEYRIRGHEQAAKEMEGWISLLRQEGGAKDLVAQKQVFNKKAMALESFKSIVGSVGFMALIAILAIICCSVFENCISDVIRTPILFVSAMYIYFIPYQVAFNRNILGVNGVLIINLLFGWTMIGWVGALIWAVSAKRDGIKDA